jgi:Rrf2 family iron-sulfur cluster assembly transcriptional regulator
LALLLTRQENRMRMSTKGRFAIDALIDMTLRQAQGPVSLASISARQQVSLSYLEQMFGRLRRVGIVDSTRGPGGGYTLGRSASQVTVAEIVSAVDEPMNGDESGLSRELWQKLNEVMLAHMETITLESLVESHRVQGAEIEPVRRRRLAAPAHDASVHRPSGPNSVFALGRSLLGGL